MSEHKVGPCDSCGTTTRGQFCIGCSNRVDDASKAFRESLAEAMEHKENADE